MYDNDAPKKFSALLKEIGFVVLVNHPIDKDDIYETYNEWKKFFNSQEKFEYIRGKHNGEGYVPREIENAKGYSTPDLKEFYHFYKWGRQPQNINTASTIRLYDALTTLGVNLLHWLDSNMPQELANQLTMPLTKMIEDSNRHLLRLLHYPQLPKHTVGMRSAPHGDINLLTLLPVSTAAGLELLDKQGNWQAVIGEANSIIVNTADMLDLATSGYYKSVIHRVINPTDVTMNQSRYAAPFFVHPRQDVDLKNGFTAREFWIQRLKEIGLYYNYLCIDQNIEKNKD